MKTRLIRLAAAVVLSAGLVAVGVHVAQAGPPPASWERDNPARCPYPHNPLPRCETPIGEAR